MCFKKLWHGLTRTHQPVPVTELAEMATCETRVLLAHRFGKRYTPKQKQAAQKGIQEHELHDRRMKYLFTAQPLAKALRVALVAVVPVTLVGEWLQRGMDIHPVWKTFGLFLTLPGVFIRALTQQGPTSELSLFAAYLCAQLLFITLLVYILLNLDQLLPAVKRETP